MIGMWYVVGGKWGQNTSYSLLPTPLFLLASDS